MKNDLDKIKAKFMPFIGALGQYKVIIFIVFVVTIYSVLILRINLLNNREPDDSAITTQLETVPRPRIDEATVQKIEQLQDNSVEVKTLFNSARKNPFQE